VRAPDSALADGARSVALAGLDRLDLARRRSDPLVPPRRLSRVSAGDFLAVGEEVLRQLKVLGGLSADADVLDVGSGSGRVAIPLTSYLDGGSYAGFDVGADVIAWCQQAITPRFPAFRFTTIDIANTHYNRDGAVEPGRARFPYDDATFDFALATSLFTHMMPSGFANYAIEIVRTMRPGGRLFATFFLLDDEVVDRQQRGATRIDLRHELFEAGTGIGYRALSRRNPEAAVGLDEVFVTGTLAEAGLNVEAVHRGSWSGHAGTPLDQDVVIATRQEHDRASPASGASSQQGCRGGA